MLFLKIIRPFNCLFVALTILFGAYYNSINNNFWIIIFAMVSATLIAGAGYVINDFFDLPIDIINKPHRVLPSGKISPKTAYIYAVLLFISGITLSFFTQNIYCVLIAILNSLILFFYAKSFKMSFLIGNILIAYTAASTFIYGGLSNNNFKNGLIVAIYAFLYTLIREFIKDSEDIEGDVKFGARTLAIKVGRKNITLISILPILCILIFNYFLLYLELITLTTFLILNLLVSVPLILFTVYLLRKLNKYRFSRISLLMKINMLVLLIILWVG